MPLEDHLNTPQEGAHYHDDHNDCLTAPDYIACMQGRGYQIGTGDTKPGDQKTA